MAAILSRLRSLFTSNSIEPTATDLNNVAEAALSPPANSVFEPSGFSRQDAQQGFYNTIIADDHSHRPLSTEQQLIINRVETSLKDQSIRIKAVPRLPSVIPKLLKSLRDPNASAKDYVNIINKDPALSTAVLKMANSAYFNPTATLVTSIETAVVKLGLQGLRTVLSTAVMQPVIQQKSTYYNDFGHKLWTHSTYCAAACEIIARQRQLEPFKAYLLGLVHDIGKITLFSQLSGQFSAQANIERPGHAAFTSLIQPTAKALSATIAKDWVLPDDICSALEQQVTINDHSVLSPYAHVLYLANLITEIFAIAKQNPDQFEAAEQALEELGLSADIFEQLESLDSSL